jgi:hypothetical protein
MRPPLYLRKRQTGAVKLMKGSLRNWKEQGPTPHRHPQNHDSFHHFLTIFSNPSLISNFLIPFIPPPRLTSTSRFRVIHVINTVKIWVGKGFFPYLIVKKENFNYVVPFPDSFRQGRENMGWEKIQHSRSFPFSQSSMEKTLSRPIFSRSWRNEWLGNATWMSIAEGVWMESGNSRSSWGG